MLEVPMGKQLSNSVLSALEVMVMEMGMKCLWMTLGDLKNWSCLLMNL